MSTKVKQNINRTSVKLAALLTAGLIGGALIPSLAWAQGEPQKFDSDACNEIKGQKVMVFVVGQNPPVKAYFAGSGTIAPWAPGTSKPVTLRDSVSIGVSVGNPVYCYTLGGSRFCVTY